jgi:S1-C subfamily serine protease
MTAVILLMLLAGTSPADCPGWLGLGFLYHAPARNRDAGGWMFVQQLAPGGPAARAGILPGDVVSAMDGQPLRYADAYSLMQRLSRVRPNDVARLTVRRGTRTFDVNVRATQISASRCLAWRQSLDVMRPRQR